MLRMLVAAILPLSLMGGTVIADGIFDTLNWTTVDASGPGVLTNSGWVLTGGNPDEHVKHRVDFDPMPTGSSTNVDIQRYFSVLYNPSVGGAITGLSLALSTLNAVTDSLPSGLRYHVAISQNGVQYFTSAYFTSQESWQISIFTAGLASGWELANGTVGTPDFSTGGAPISFGYRATLPRSCSGPPRLFCEGGTVIDSVDNFEVTISTVAEPATWALLGVGLAASLERRRRIRARN